MEPHLPTLFDAVARTRPGSPAIETPGGVTTWGALMRRTDALGAALHAAGVTAVESPTRSGDGWACPNPRVALYLHNHPAYLEAMVGAWKARATAANVNYRYRADELVHLLGDARPAAVVYHQCFASTLADVLGRLAVAPLLWCVPDGSGHELLPGARWYEDVLAEAPPLPDSLRQAWHPEDRYLVYTGGTTGAPKGVLWRQSDFAVAALGFDPTLLDGPDGITGWAEALPARPPRSLIGPPFMHGAAHWNALAVWLKGGTVLLPAHPERFDPDAVLDAVEWGEATAMIIVGDAFARPLLEADDRRHRSLVTLRHLLTGGAILSPSLKAELVRRWPRVTVVDVLGSSESGRQAVHHHRGTDGTEEPSPRAFHPDDHTVIVSEGGGALIVPPPASPAAGPSEVGWLARTGRVPLGYLGQRDATKATFPVVGGLRAAVTGDRARYQSDGGIELLGREAACINTGGEKVFAEEVEERLRHHPSVLDLVVAPAADEQFGQAVGVVAAERSDGSLKLEDLREFGRVHLADYKLPRRLVVVGEVVRSPSGKPDYAWARRQLDVGARSEARK